MLTLIKNTFCKILKKNPKLPTYVIDIGHSKTDPGAINYIDKITEFQFNEFLATRILEIYANMLLCSKVAGKDIAVPLADIFNLELVYREDYKNLPTKINKLKPKFVVSLHCNAFDCKASGTEVLARKDSKDSVNLANYLRNLNIKTLGLRDRGTVYLTKEDRGGYLLYNLNSPAVISEPFFLDNSSDLEIAADKIDELAENVIKSFLVCEGLEGVII